MSYCLGVDLGTTFVAAALAHATRVEMFTLGDRSVVIPATVYLREDGVLVTGEAANRRAVSSPDRVGREFKRRLGNPTPMILGGRPYDATALLGSLLRDVLRKVSEIEGDLPERVVLTHPANWGPFRRALFEEVPRYAGLENPPLTTEPEAAAAYYVASRHLRDGEIVAVYDLGGGTFDATVLHKHPGGVEILGTPEGIERLGGIDFDEAILSFVDYTAGGALSELDMGDPRTLVALARLRQDCVLAKEALSVDTETILPVFLPGRHFEVRLARSELENMVRAPIESTIGALARTLQSARVEAADLSAVLLVGGSSRIPVVAEMVSAQLGRPTVVNSHPKYSVALGAAMLAAQAARPSGRYAEPRSTTPAPVSQDGRPARWHGPQRESSSTGPRPVEPRAGGVDGAVLLDERPGAPAQRRRATSPAPSPGTGRLPPAALPPADPPPAGPPPVGLAPADPPPAGLAPADLAPAGLAPADPPPADPPAPPVGGPGRQARKRGVLVTTGTLLALVWMIALAVFISMTHNRGSAHPGAAARPGPKPVVRVEPAVAIPALGAPVRAATSAQSVEVAPTGRQAYVADDEKQVVNVVDTAVNKVTATIPIETGPPQFLTFTPDGGTLYVSIFNEQRTIHLVDVIDTASNEVIATIPQRSRPYQPAVTPDGRQLYIPNHDSGSVSVVDTATNEVSTEIKVAPNPHGVAFSPDGRRAYTANHESNLISVIDTATQRVLATIEVQTSPHSVAVNPQRPLSANVNYDAGSVSMIDTTTNRVVATVPVGQEPQDIAWAPDGRFAYVVNNGSDSVSVLDAGTNRLTATIPTGTDPTNISVLPDGRRGYVSNLDGTLTVLELTG